MPAFTTLLTSPAQIDFAALAEDSGCARRRWFSGGTS